MEEGKKLAPIFFRKEDRDEGDNLNEGYLFLKI